jgi:hypothetical protein
MIRISALAPLDGSYDAILEICEQFMLDTLPYMFEAQKKDPSIISMLFAKGPVTSTIVIILALLVPFAIMFYPQIRDMQRRKDMRRGRRL